MTFDWPCNGFVFTYIQITKLKIDSNPFAKGFRDSSRLGDVDSVDGFLVQGQGHSPLHAHQDRCHADFDDSLRYMLEKPSCQSKLSQCINFFVA